MRARIQRIGLNLDIFLARYGLSQSEVVRGVNKSIDLGTPLIFVAGSVAEGFANKSSDLDIYVVSDMHSGCDFSIFSADKIDLGGLLCEINLLSRNAVDELIERFSTWAAKPRSTRAAMEFNQAERVMLHRIRHSIPLTKPEQLLALRDRIPLESLMRHKVDWARHHANALQSDLYGLKREGDFHGMVPLAQELLNHVGDALISAFGYTTPAWKWRTQILTKLTKTKVEALIGSEFESPLHWFQHYHRAPINIEKDAVAFTRHILKFARWVLPLAEWRCYGNVAKNWLAPSYRSQASSPLPALTPDTVVQFYEGQFQLFRLQVRDRIFNLTPELLSLLSCFDGHTDYRQTLAHAYALWLQDEAEKNVNNLNGLLRQSKLLDSPELNKRVLESLL